MKTRKVLIKYIESDFAFTELRKAGFNIGDTLKGEQEIIEVDGKKVFKDSVWVGSAIFYLGTNARLIE